MSRFRMIKRVANTVRTVTHIRWNGTEPYLTVAKHDLTVCIDGDYLSVWHGEYECLAASSPSIVAKYINSL